MDNHDAAAPAHLWAVGLLALLWNAIGVISFLATQTGNLASLGMSESQIAYFDSFPFGAVAFWALGVWGAFFGSLLLLFQSRHAVASLALSILGLTGTTIYQRFINAPPADLANPALEIAIWAITLALLWYAVRMRARGVLR